MTTSCRVCRFELCETWMDFGPQPNSVRLLCTPDEAESTYPLALSLCPSCGFIFLPDAMPPEAFYGDVQMPTSLFPARHLPALVEEIKTRTSAQPAPAVFEIGSNDGYFLDLLRRSGFDKISGIEPSDACAAQARALGLRVETGFFTREKGVALHQAGRNADVVVCRHVLEHILNLDDFLSGLTTLLAPEGLVVLEVPDLSAIAEKGDPSAIWEQHVNYFDLPVLTRLLARFGLRVSEARHLPHGGGTLLTFLQRGVAPETLPPVPAREGMATRLGEHIALLKTTLERLRVEGMRIVAFGAGMRGTMLINLAGIGPMLEAVLDDNPSKVGRFLPGSRLPIRPTSLLVTDPPDVCLVLPLNAKETEGAVIARFAQFQKEGGCFLELFPEEGDFLKARP